MYPTVTFKTLILTQNFIFAQVQVRVTVFEIPYQYRIWYGLWADGKTEITDQTKEAVNEVLN